MLITPACYDPLYRRAVRVSMGTVFQIPWARIGEDAHDWAQTGIPLLHELGFTTAALALSDNSVSLRGEKLKECEKIALVLGTEADAARGSGSTAGVPKFSRVPKYALNSFHAIRTRQSLAR